MSTNLSLSYTNAPSEFLERDIGRWRLQVIRESYFFILSWAWGKEKNLSPMRSQTSSLLFLIPHEEARPMSYMNFVIDLTHCGVPVAQW